MGPLPPLHREDLDRTERFFERWGAWASFLGRMVPVIRSLVSFGAGVGRMHLGPFILFTVLGSSRGTCSSSWRDTSGELAASGFLRRYEYLILGILVIVALGWVWLRFVRPWLAARRDVRAHGQPGA